MKITIATGSRADWGLLEIIIKALQADSYFQGQILRVWGMSFDEAFRSASENFNLERPDLLFILGDRFEILAVATAAHLQRIPIAHLGGGDVTEGSYDDAMRDCITRMSSIHFVTSHQSEARVSLLMGQKNVHLVGSPGVDYIMSGEWKKERPIKEPYVVVAYYPETIDGTVNLGLVNGIVGLRKAVWIKPNPDAGSEKIPGDKSYEHSDFLNLLYHCDEFIGNSSAIYYEAPFLGVKTCEVGKRQKGRVVPFGDGKACERIVKVLKEWPCS